MQKEGFSEALAKCPKFEGHSFRFGGAVLEDAFLDERAKQMGAVLTAWVENLNVTLEPPQGPAPLLAFLSGEDGAEPGTCETPRGSDPLASSFSRSIILPQASGMHAAMDESTAARRLCSAASTARARRQYMS